MITASYNGAKFKSTVTVYKKPVVIFNKVDWDEDFLGGISPEITLTNGSNKTIKYISINTEYYNRVGDPAYSDIGGRYKENLLITGPIKKNVKDTYYWDPVLYNSTTSAIKITSVKVTFMDGTKQTVKVNKLWYDKYYYKNK